MKNIIKDLERIGWNSNKETNLNDIGIVAITYCISRRLFRVFKMEQWWGGIYRGKLYFILESRRFRSFE